MIYRILGRTNIKVSTVALGCEGFVNLNYDESLALMDFAINNGVNFIDIYTSNPDVRKKIGDSLKGRRESFVIQGHLCTTWENGQYLRTREPEKIRPAFEDLLTQLQTDYIDVGMIHYVDAADDFELVMNGDVLKISKELQSEGKIRHLGISSHNPIVAKRAVESGIFDVLMFSINAAYDLQPPTEDIYSFWESETWNHELINIDPERENLYSLCEQSGVGIDVMKVYGGGDLLSEANSPFGKAMTPVQCMEYALSRPGVAAIMVGCKSQDELSQALAWCSATPEQRDYTPVLRNLQKFSWQGHCMYCGHCAPCTAEINIADVNKFYNLTEAQNCIPETVREHYKALPHHASECIGCGVCESRCPFGVNIIEAMEKASQRFGF